MRFILWENGFSILFLFVALYYANVKFYKKEQKHARFQDDDVEMADIGGTQTTKLQPDKNTISEEYTKDEVIREMYRKRNLSHGSILKWEHHYYI